MSKYNFMINVKDEDGRVIHSMIYTTQKRAKNAILAYMRNENAWNSSVWHEFDNDKNLTWEVAELDKSVTYIKQGDVVESGICEATNLGYEVKENEVAEWVEKELKEIHEETMKVVTEVDRQNEDLNAIERAMNNVRKANIAVIQKDFESYNDFSKDLMKIDFTRLDDFASKCRKNKIDKIDRMAWCANQAIFG